jgi:hypothetical protein
MPRISDEFLGSVAYIYPSVATAKRGEHIGGSALLAACRLSDESPYAQLYVITNRHVIEDLNSRTIAIRFNSADGKTNVIQTASSVWIKSFGDDLAVLPIDLSNSDCKGTVIPDSIFLTENLVGLYDIGPGDETFMVGRLITHDGKQQNTPLVRFGNISMMPLEPIHSKDGDQIAFLVECRSLSGFSGSPVFVWIPAGSWRPTHQPFERLHGPWLLGINCGHITLPEKIRSLSSGKQISVEEHSAIEVVVPAWKLQELLNQESLKQGRLKLEKEIENKEKRGFVAYDSMFDRLEPS